MSIDKSCKKKITKKPIGKKSVLLVIKKLQIKIKDIIIIVK